MIKQYKDKGFTLLEMGYVLLILLLLFVACIPLWQSFTLRHRLQERADKIISIVTFTRNQVLKSHHSLVISGIDGEWSDGVIVFSDANRNHHIDDGEQILRQWRWSSKQIVVAWQGFHSDHYIEFAQDPSNSAMNGRFVIHAKKDPTQRRIVALNRLGKAYLYNENQ